MGLEVETDVATVGDDRERDAALTDEELADGATMLSLDEPVMVMVGVIVVLVVLPEAREMGGEVGLEVAMLEAVLNDEEVGDAMFAAVALRGMGLEAEGAMLGPEKVDAMAEIAGEI